MCDEAIAIRDEQGNILGYTNAGAYRTHPSSRKSELRLGARRLFLPPEVIASKLEQLVSIMNTVLATKLSQEQMVENVLSFAVEFSTIHPFANQNGRMMQLLMELIAYQAGIEPFYVSQVNKLNSYQLTRAIEETILYQTVQPLKTIISRYKSEQNISNIKIDDSPSIGNYFAHSKRESPNLILQDTGLGLLLPTLKDKKILDAGCGMGTYAKYFVENGATVIGIDASQVAIDKAKQMSLEQATFMVGDLEKPLDYFDNESFDFIFSYLVIHYIEDWDRLFKDFFRMLKVGGSILIAVSHPSKNVVSDYFSVEKTTETFYRNGQTISIEYYRRPLQNMLNTMINAGFHLDKTIEFKHKVVDRFYIAFRLYKHTSGLPSDTTMEQALGMAKQAFDAGDFPVGSVMVSNGEVVSKARNEIFTKNNYHHAEINLIAKSLSHQKVEHKVVYVTLEPCWRCAQALVDFGVKEVFYILEDPQYGGINTLHQNKIKTTKLDIYEKEYAQILFDFFAQNEHFQHMPQCKALYEHIKKHINTKQTIDEASITLIIRKIFDDYDEKNGAQQKTDYTQRAKHIVQTWTQSMAKEGLTTKLICELHRLVCEDEWIPINDPKGGIAGFAKSGEYRTTLSSAQSLLNKGSRTHFLAPSDILSRMQYLVQTMNGDFSSNVPKETMIENIVSFTVEILTIHPFANQNGRLAQVLMELFAFQGRLEPFYISFVCKRDYPQICKSCEEVIALQSAEPFVKVMSNFYKSAEIDFEKYVEQTK